MNQFSILMHLLSKKDTLYEMGATKEEILAALNLKTKNDDFFFQNLITNLSNHLEIIGLRVKYNPLDSHWFVSFDLGTSELISANPFKDQPKLAATLFVTLVSCINNSGVAKLHQIRDLRKKKLVLEDLRELEIMGYLKIDKIKGEVQLTPLIGYKLDLEYLFVKLALKLKENELE
ncbi:MAG: hypothetical protein ACFFAS_20050 [Promethearchaeota archaeon]